MKKTIVTFLSMAAWAGIAVAATPQEQWLNRAYQDLLNRAPSAVEMQAFLPQSGTPQGRAQDVMIIAISPEYRSLLIGSMYQQYLKRSASVAELNFAVGAFSTDEAMRANVIGSTEYFQTRADNSPAQFVNAMYGDILNRQPSAQEAAYFVAAQQGQTRAIIAISVLRSVEALAKLAADDYLRYLGRPIDKAASAAAVQFLQTSTDEQYLASLLSSTEYFDNAQLPSGLDVMARFSQASATAFNGVQKGTANLLVQVTDAATGAPTSGLTQDKFKVTGHFMLPGQLCNFTSPNVQSFAEVGSGWYQFTVGLPAGPSCTWVPGDYLANVVMQGGKQGAAAAVLTIQ